MALCTLCTDEQGIIFSQLCNALEPHVAVYFGSVSCALRSSTQAQRQQLKVQHVLAAALCHKLGMRSCKGLREAKQVRDWRHKPLAAADLATLGALGSVLPALEELRLFESSGGAAGPDGVQRLAVGLSAGALPAVNSLTINNIYIGDAGASALAAALGRGALPRLVDLNLNNTNIGNAGLVALAPVLQRRSALETLNLACNLFGDEGLAALVVPAPSAGAPPLSTGVLPKLEELDLRSTQMTDAGCATLASALDSGALPALEKLELDGTPARAAAKAAVYEARANLHETVYETASEHESGSEEDEGEDDSGDGEEDD